MNTASNQIWKNESNPLSWELRRYRFPDETRPLYFRYLGLTPDSRALDGGCGTGVFTRFLAKGMNTGRVDGFDISPRLVAYGIEMIEREDLSGAACLLEADGFALPYSDNEYDAVTNYTYLGVLSDPMAGLQELIRVCKPGGTVSCVCAGGPFLTWRGEYGFPGAQRLDELHTRQEKIFSRHVHSPAKYFQTSEWEGKRYPKLFDVCGLSDIHICPVAFGFSYSDSRFPLSLRRELADDGIRDDIRILRGRQESGELESHGFSRKDYDELITLLVRKSKYLAAHMEDDRSFEWQATLNYIVSGTKRG